MTIYPLVTTLHTSIGLGWTILGILLLVGLAAWSYRWTRPPLPTWAKASLAVLRALALIAVWLLVLGFEVRWEREVPDRPDVGILIDASESMSFDSRPDSLRALLNTPVWADLQDDIRFEYYNFSSDLSVQRSLKLPDLDGPVTNLEATLNELASRPEGPPDELVLVTDGGFNRGGAYTAAARRLGIPVNTVAIGDSLPPKDLVISSLAAPDLGYAGETFPLDVTVREAGAAGQTVTLRVIGSNGQVLESRDITFEGDWSEQTVSFNLTPQRAGVNSWTVEVAPLDGEVDTENNARRAVMRVAERRRTVLVISPAPHPDAGTVARVLEEDSDTDAIVIIGAGRMDNRMVRGDWADADPAEVDAALVFLDGPYTDRARQAIARIADADLPTVWFAGDDVLPDRVLDVVGSRLGSPEPWIDPQDVILRPVAAHAIFTDAGTFFDDGVTPPVTRGPYRPREGRTLAATQVDVQDIPTVVVGQSTPRTIVWYASGLARWDRVRRTDDPGGTGFSNLMDRMLRWLTSGGEEDRIVVRSEQELYAGGEEVQLHGSVADHGLAPVEDARITAEVQREGGESRTVEFQSLGGGRYTARFLPWGEGRYDVSATVETDQEKVERNAEFVVDRFDLESAERRMRPDRLRAIADATGGGVVWSVANADTLAQLLPRSERWVDERGAWRPFGLWLTLLLVVGMLAAEWLIRTRTGMA